MRIRRISYGLVVMCIILGFGAVAFAGSPSGTNWFQLKTSVTTGGDNTGDGGTGNPSDYNYYYVGQSFDADIEISSDGTNAANIWIDHDPNYASASNLNTGTYFPSWAGQTITNEAPDLTRIKSTGYRTAGTSTGVGNFGSVRFSALQPTAANYGTGAAETLDVNIGVVSDTTESNISLGGTDKLEDAEDFNFHIWADTKKPYAQTPNPPNGSTGISVSTNYAFEMRDSKNGAGDNSGVGTGVNTSLVIGTVDVDDGGGAIEYDTYVNFSCSGTWGTNLCDVTLNPPSPASIAGDSRNWEYNTTYAVTVRDFEDNASSNQDQLGDANGPNVMDSQTWTFTTESDTTRPEVDSETPSRGSTGIAVDTSMTITVLDKKTYPGSVSGSGVDPSTCEITLTPPSYGGSQTFAQGVPGVSVSAVDYGYRYSFDPPDFAENEVVSIVVANCEDAFGNIMTPDSYSFTTVDGSAPYVDGMTPAADTIISEDQVFEFHIKDDGQGVDLSNMVVYVNGNYYTQTAGSSGTVTNAGTVISYSGSLSFAGGNYAGDTTGISGSVNDTTVTIEPEVDFTAGEGVSIIVYASDGSGNLMERAVYEFSVAGGGCPAGSSYCGTDTSWSGSMCVGTGGGSGDSYCGANTTWNGSTCIGSTFACGLSGGNNTILIMNPTISNVSLMQSDDTSLFLTWQTSMPGASQVAYGRYSVSSPKDSAPFGYENVTTEVSGLRSFHNGFVTDLVSGETYYIRPISFVNGRYVYGPELRMSMQFVTQCPVTETVAKEVDSEQTEKTERVAPAAQPVITRPVEQRNSRNSVKIIEVQQGDDGRITVFGNASPGERITIRID